MPDTLSVSAAIAGCVCVYVCVLKSRGRDTRRQPIPETRRGLLVAGGER